MANLNQMYGGKMNKVFIILSIVFGQFIFWGLALSQEIPDGPYLGQNPPGLKPVIFAPGIISLPDRNESHPTFSPDGNQFFFAVPNDNWRKVKIMYMKNTNGHWTTPDTIYFEDLFHDPRGKYKYGEPFFSPDGKKLFFQSTRPPGSHPFLTDIWMTEQTKKGWGKPAHLGSPVNSPAPEWYPCLTQNGTLYFCSGRKKKYIMDIYRSELINGQYMMVECLNDSINSDYSDYDAYIAPDESYMIFGSTRPGIHGEWKFYISFRKKDGTWTKAKYLNEIINSGGDGWCPKVTNDGKYFFFARTTSKGNTDIYWVDSRSLFPNKSNK